MNSGAGYINYLLNNRFFITCNNYYIIIIYSLSVDSKTLIPMRFKFHPPKLSQISVPNSNPSLQDDRLDLLPDSGHLLEFSPTYSGKSCLKHQQKECNRRGFDGGNVVWRWCDVQKLSDLPRQGSHRPTLPSAGHDSSEKNKLPLEELNPLGKSVSDANYMVRISKDRR